MPAQHNLIISLGGIPVLLFSKEKRIIDLLRDAFKGFICPNCMPRIKIDILFDEQLQDINPYIYGNPHKTNVIKVGHKLLVRGSIYRGTFDLEMLKGEIQQGISVAPVYLFLRFVVSAYLPLANGLLMHSTSVARDGKSFLFSGPPQSGKSTIARLSSDYHVLSDDFSIIRKMNGKFCCFGSPFWGHVEAKGENIKGKRQCAPIKGIYFLKQDDETYLRKLGKLEASIRLIKNISVIAKDNDINRDIIKMADELTEETPAYILHFKLNNDFWRCIK